MRRICGGLEPETSVGEVWSVDRCMSGIGKSRSIPVLEEGGVIVSITSVIKKAIMCTSREA